MSWGTCYGASNNIHFDFPPLMSDGRNFATWIPACKINEDIQHANDITTNYEYRQYLTKNADKTLKATDLKRFYGCCPSTIQRIAGRLAPEGKSKDHGRPPEETGRGMHAECVS